MDTGLFDIEADKTILVGPNEAGKTAVLQALQRLHLPEGIDGFVPLRDYPRSEYNDIKTGKVNPADVTVVEGHFILEPDDRTLVPTEYADCTYVVGCKLNNEYCHWIENAPEIPKYSLVKNDLLRLGGHADKQFASNPKSEGDASPSDTLSALTADWNDETSVDGDVSAKLSEWLDATVQYVSEGDGAELAQLEKLSGLIGIAKTHAEVKDILWNRRPLFVLFSNYFRVRPNIHLDHLATRLETETLDDAYYDYGNKCLLNLLGFTARELSDLGRVVEPNAGNAQALEQFRNQLDSRTYQLNAASIKLTKEIRGVWNPDTAKAEADRLRVQADGQYLKVVVEDDLGVEIELDQRSEGFQWLVSFFVVFFAETEGQHSNAILLLDEPGLSLHGLKQREFRKTISKLSESNQTLYTTHSPFLVGPSELDLVRVVEMNDRTIGTRVHTTVTADDPASLLPLQEALGYDLAQSLFVQKRNLVIEGLTDYWYIEATAALLRAEGLVDLNEQIALVPAQSAGKVVYYATILHAQNLKVAALLDSDAAGEQAAKQDTLVHQLGNKRILRTKDAYSGPVSKCEIEDLLRETLIGIANNQLGWNIETVASQQPNRAIIDIFNDNISGFSKYRLAKAYIRWTRDNDATALKNNEKADWISMVGLINKALK